MTDQYGLIFTIRLRTFQALVVSGTEMAKECFTKNDVTLSTRPRHLAQKILGYSYAMFPLAPYGPYWHEVRKMVTLELLSSRRVNSFLNPIQASEADLAIQELHELGLRKDDSGHIIVDLKQWFAKLTLNVTLRIVAGKRYRAADEQEKQQCQKALREFVDFFGLFLSADALPFLRWLDLGGHEKAMKRTAEELDEIIGGWLEDHKRDNKDLGLIFQLFGLSSNGGDMVVDSEVKELQNMVDTTPKELLELHKSSAEQKYVIVDPNERLNASLQSCAEANEIMDSQKASIAMLKEQLVKERDQRREERERAAADLTAAVQRVHAEAQEMLPQNESKSSKN
ncbi:cytochrome P450 82A4-like [Eucalyptus grandis]|uniref:cytochrome P450 82A4-like n=1 Tax=Eucalyptus grandis TaxID=71139 RepID=UPI0005265C48|nr:cytochrome P450 82A4-like [Eucalyptus grandis]